MRKFKCSICGFIYDEAVGMREKGIEAGTKWEDIPQDFSCPLCGVPKTAFEELKEKSNTPANAAAEEIQFEGLKDLSAGELSALCSNLAKGCEKQHLAEESALFNQLADYFNSKVNFEGEKSFGDAAQLLAADLEEYYPKANVVVSAAKDRGALRALVWSEKVSRMIKSLLDTYEKKGDAMLEDTNIFVCDICGFVYAGKELPEVCPVCKVPKFKFAQIARR